MSGNKPSICIVLLIGIPASGKSHFRQYLNQLLVNHNPSTDVLKNVYVVPVSYDDYIDGDDINSGYNNWKSKRIEICNHVENVINCLNKKQIQTDCLLNGVFDVSIALQSNFVIFIIDDNMYYQSMRYQYYKLARKYNTGFCQFYLKVSLKDALKQNSQRNENIVSETTILKMFSKLEPPNINNNWECYSLQINSFADFNETSLSKSVTDIIVQCLKNPVVSLNDMVNKKDEAQEITNSNMLHQIDLILRRIVGERVKEASIEITNKDNLKVVSKLYCKKKQLLLEKIKKGEIALPFSSLIFQKIAIDDIELVKTFLLQHI